MPDSNGTGQSPLDSKTLLTAGAMALVGQVPALNEAVQKIGVDTTLTFFAGLFAWLRLRTGKPLTVRNALGWFRRG